MRGQRVLFVGGQGPVSAPAVRLLAPDNEVFAMARFSDPDSRQRLESVGVTCITHDLFDSFEDLPDDFDYVYYSALPMSSVHDPLGSWPHSYDAYADATGRLMAHFPGVKGFLFASSVSVYDPPGGDTPAPETHPFGIHTYAAYAFTKVANEAIVSYVCRSLNMPTTIIRVGSASGVDGGPMRDRLDLLVQGKPIPVHPDKPSYFRPIFEPDCARLGVAALEAGRVPPLVVNWCGDDIVSVEEYCTFMGQLIGKEPTFEYTPDAYCSLVPDTTLRREVLGDCEVRWQDGCRKLVHQCYPELVR
ncbi:MAG: NAD(P)-dependent oxidoreductase [Acidimicrobiaceae bacterium]|nr:NAD(P)-dependent oxidoreductase [Acidimicrobiaceae bacterium]